MRRQQTFVSILLLAVVGGWAYHSSLAVPFLFDDERAIVANPHLRHLWPVWDAMAAPAGDTTVAGRPILSLSFALNAVVGGLDPRGYHVVNVFIHLLAALCLFGVVRRTPMSPSWLGRDDATAPYLALSAALLWLVHPLNTQAVIYVSQRAESLAGLWYLLTLYGAIRASASARPARWQAASVLACALGMATKEIVATAPLLVFLYDWTFLGGTARGILRRRRGYYAALAATWLLGTGLLLTSARLGSTRLEDAHLPGPLQYGLTQCGVILHYLRLAVWPHPLVFDYGWPVAALHPWTLAQLLLIGALLGLTCWAVWRRHPLGYVGAWVFLILAPTSSLLPIQDAAFEHRMYLPLMAIVTLGVVAADARLRRLPQSLRRGLVIGLVLGLGTMTIARHRAYANALALWSDTVAKRPANARAHNNLGAALARAGRFEDAAEYFTTSLVLDPTQADAHYNLAQLYLRQGRAPEAVPHLRQTVRLRPHDWEAFRQLRDAERPP